MDVTVQTNNSDTTALWQRIDPVSILMGIAFALIWSSAFSVAKVALEDSPPFLILTLRFLVSGLLATGFALAIGQRMKLTSTQWLAVLILGICQNSLYLGLNFQAMTVIDASLTAIIASTLPLIVALLGLVFRLERLGLWGLVGLAAGMIGVLIIMVSRFNGGADAGGLALCVIAACALAAATMIMRGVDLGKNLLMIVGLQMLCGGLSLVPVTLWLEDPALLNPTWRLGAAFTYIVLLPGIVATLIWFRLIQRIGAVRASVYHFLNPALGAMFASFMLGELISVQDMIGVVVLTTGILLVQLDRGR